MDDMSRGQGGGLNAVAAAIINRRTGETTLGYSHFDCRVAAYRILTGTRKTKNEIILEDEGFDIFLQENSFEDGFVNGILEFMSRPIAMQMVSSEVTELHSQEILRG